MSVSILVVDDETDAIDLFKRQFRHELESGVYVMHIAQSGEDALELIKYAAEPEAMLVLADINMPGMSGLELLERAKQRWPLLPLIIVTAYGDPENRRNAYEAGASDFVTKPVDFNNLKARINNILTMTVL